MIDEPRVVADLLALADRYETKAKRLREAAAIVRDDEPMAGPTTAPAPANDAVTDKASATPDGRVERQPALPADWYLDVMRQQPSTDWDAVMLAQAVNEARGTNINKEAARAMLYRMEDRGAITKSGRGTWRIKVEDEGDPAPSQDPADRPFVSVVR